MFNSKDDKNNGDFLSTVQYVRNLEIIAAFLTPKS